MDKDLTELDAVVTPADTDLIYTVTDVSTTPTDKKSTWTTIKAFLKTYFDSLTTTFTNKVIELNPAIGYHLISWITVTKTAGEAIMAGQVCYLKSDGKMWLAKADAVATAGPCLIGLATDTIASNATGVFLLKWYFQDFFVFSMTPCVPQYISAATAGAITETAPSTATNIARIIGYAETADIIYFSPDNTWLEI